MLMYLSRKYGSANSPCKFNTVIHGESMLEYCPPETTITRISNQLTIDQKPRSLSKNLFLPYSLKKRNLDRQFNNLVLQRKAISKSKVAVQKLRKQFGSSSKEVNFPQIINKKLSKSKDLTNKQTKSIEIYNYDIREDSKMITIENRVQNNDYLKCSKNRRIKSKVLQEAPGKRKTEGDIMMTNHGWIDQKMDREVFGMTRFFT